MPGVVVVVRCVTLSPPAVVELTADAPQCAFVDVDGAGLPAFEGGQLEHRHAAPRAHHPRVRVSRVECERMPAGLQGAHLPLSTARRSAEEDAHLS